MQLGYWDIRGRVGPTRLMLAYKEVDYEDVRYKFDVSDPAERQWSKEKETFGFAFPNLPYLIDGDVKLTESWAVMRYLARKFDLVPTSDCEERDIDMVAGVLQDLIVAIGTLAYGKEVAEKREGTRTTQLVKFKLLDKFLAGRDFAAGAKLTYVDFVAYEVMDWYRMLYPSIFTDLNNLQSYIKRFEALPTVAAHISSDKYKRFPIFAPMASWGGKDHDDKTW